MIELAGLVGVGSMCRRPVHGADGLIAVVERLDQVLPRQTSLHLFAVRGAAIPYLTALAHRIASFAHQPYGVSARTPPRRRAPAMTYPLGSAHQTARWPRQHLCVDRL